MAVKIFVDAGHGGTDPGAMGNGVIEQAVNLNVANRLADLLRSNGYEVKQYRTTTTKRLARKECRPYESCENGKRVGCGLVCKHTHKQLGQPRGKRF